MILLLIYAPNQSCDYLHYYSPRSVCPSMYPSLRSSMHPKTSSDCCKFLQNIWNCFCVKQSLTHTYSQSSHQFNSHTKKQPPIVQNQPGPCSSDATKACFSMMTKEGSSSTFESTPRKKDWKLVPWRGGDACCCVSLCSDCQQGNHNWDNKGHKPEDFRGMGPVYLG